MTWAREWYTKDVAVVNRVIELHDVPVYRSPPGVGVLTVGKRAHRSFTRATGALLQQPTVEPQFPSGSSFVQTDAELDRRVQQARALDAYFGGMTGELAVIERSQSAKICFQRGGAPGWWMLPDGLVAADADSLSGGMRAVRSLLARQDAERPPSFKYKKQTNHGWPDYNTTDTSLILHRLWGLAAGLDFDRLLAVGARIAAALGEDTPFSATMFNRSGPLKKPVPIQEASPLGIKEVGTMQGACPRRRIVYGMPSAGNMLQVSAGEYVKSAMKRVPWLWHFGPEDVARKIAWFTQRNPRVEWKSDDISGYDMSVSDRHQRELVTIGLQPFLTASEAAFKLRWKDIPLLGPGIRPGEEGFLYRKVGGTASGDYFTSIDGTLINAARVIECAGAAMGVSPAKALATLGSSWMFLCQGDDTVIGAATRPWDWQAYGERSLELGYTTTRDEGCVFLMHYIAPKTGRTWPLASRVFQQTVFNEYGGTSFAAELFSFAARTEKFANRSPYAGMLWSLLADSALFDHWGVRRVDDVWRVLADPEFQATLARDLRANQRFRIQFKGLVPAGISSLLASLVVPSEADISAPEPISQDEALSAALSLAEWMGTPTSARPDEPSFSRPIEGLISQIREKDPT